MTAPSFAAAAVDELTQALSWLAASLLPGTAKPYRAPVMTPEARAARAMEDRTYREFALMGGTIPLGESPAPMDLNVMDLLSEILAAADEMAEQVAVAANIPKPRPATSAFADPGPYLSVVRIHLAVAIAADDTLARWIESKCDDLIFRTHNQLGLLGDGQVLHTVCPWCRGRTEHAIGGEHTMRVKAKLPLNRSGTALTITELDAIRTEMDSTGECPTCSHKAERHSDAKCNEHGCSCSHQIRWFIVCFGLNCSPPAEDCGYENYWRNHPAWDFLNEGAWLAKRLEWAAAS